MLSLKKPTVEVMQNFLQAQGQKDLTYSAVGHTLTTPPSDYVVDRTRCQLGQGPAVFNAAVDALKSWDQFRLGWLEARPDDTPIEEGKSVVILAHVMGLWWLNACKIVAVIDQDGPIRKFGFAYGTLPHHAGTGEERFLIEWNRADDIVWYDILAFSRPHHLLTKIGYPMVRIIQRRFGRESSAAMRRAVLKSAMKAF